MKVQTKRKIVIALILSVAFGGMYALTKMRPEPPKKSKKDLAMLIEAINLKATDEIFEVISQGTVRPRTETTLSAEVSGRIVSISNKFIAGGIFKKDEVLMQIDPTNYQVALAQADALLKQREIEFNGAKLLQKKGYRAEAELAAAKASLTAAKAGRVKAKKNLERTKIRLPYTGLVKSKMSDLGQYVNIGTQLGTTFAIDIAEVRLALTDQDLAFINLPEAKDIAETGNFHGPSVKLSAKRKGVYQQWNAHIVRTEGIVDEKSRVIYVVAQINDPYHILNTDTKNSPLPFGTFVKATIEGKTFLNVIKIPRTALRGNNELMFIDKENRLHIREVEIVRADNKFAYIKNTARNAGRISITAIESPINGMKVRTEIEVDPITADQSQAVNSN